MKHIHMIGIGGSGLSAIARLLLEMGYKVTGSDRFESSFIRDLRSAGATIAIGHHPENIAGADVVVRSSAVPEDNPEVIAALQAGIPVLKRGDFLGTLMAGRTGIAVAGTHGKTTTTAMLAWMLTALHQEPTFIVGGVLQNLGVNAHAGKGRTFIIEADEYDRMFLDLKPTIEVVTNVEHDHPDCYPTPAAFEAAFLEFIKLLPDDGTLVACVEDPGAQGIMAKAEKLKKHVVGYGIRSDKTAGRNVEVFAMDLKANEYGGFAFTASIFNQPVSVALQVPGRHNVSNALAALAVISLLNLPLVGAARALEQFKGAGRRFEVKGEAGGVTVIDDYGHHPTEIRATLSAARSRYPGRRIWAVWQPHTFSRTQMLFNEFTHAFGDADKVVVTEVYAAREPKQDYSSERVVRSMSHPSVHFVAELKDVSNYLIVNLHPGDVLLVFSAGDADQVSAQVLASLQESEAQNG